MNALNTSSGVYMLLHSLLRRLIHEALFIIINGSNKTKFKKTKKNKPTTPNQINNAQNQRLWHLSPGTLKKYTHALRTDKCRQKF